MQKVHNGFEIRSKLWMEVAGEPVFGRGRRMLLEAVERHGSINQAAKEVNISYRKAWGYIKAMEQRLGLRLVERRAGGRNGGGAALTDAAREFIGRYGEIEGKVRAYADGLFEDTFWGGHNLFSRGKDVRQP